MAEWHSDRMFEDGRYLWRTSSPTLLLRQVHPEQLEEDHIGGCCISPEKESPQPLQAAYSNALSPLKRSFPLIQMELAVLKFVPFPLCLAAGLFKNVWLKGKFCYFLCSSSVFMLWLNNICGEKLSSLTWFPLWWNSPFGWLEERKIKFKGEMVTVQ